MNQLDLPKIEEPVIPATVLIAYHAGCIDGFTSAWVVNRVMNERGLRCNLRAMEYNTDSDIKLMDELAYAGYTSLYIVDFSVSVALLDAIEVIHPELKITIMDHHKTAFEKYCPDLTVTATTSVDFTLGNTRIVLDNSKSGAGLCWSQFYADEPIPNLIDYVQDYDLWKFEFGDATRYVNKYLKEQLEIDPITDNWERIHTAFTDLEARANIMEQGRQLQKIHSCTVQDIASDATGINIKGHDGLAVCCPYKFVSDVGNTLAERCGTFGAVYQVSDDKNKVKWSLRSKGDFDVSAIAKQYGGGGHKNAAGFETSLFAMSEGADYYNETEGEEYE